MLIGWLEIICFYANSLCNLKLHQNAWRLTAYGGREAVGSELYRRRLSAYNSTFCSCLHVPIPSISFSCCMARGSVSIANKRGESGQPCLVLQWSGKYLDWVELDQTRAVGALYRTFIQDMNFCPNRNPPSGL